MKWNILLLMAILATAISSCEDDVMPVVKGDLEDITYDPTPYVVEIPDGFPQLEVPDDNPMTLEGVKLGQHLFYDPILSADSTVSCARCHKPELAFTDGLRRSVGINNGFGTRSSMSLVNVGFYYNGLFWDGRVKTLEEQSLHPIENPVEQGNTLDKVVAALQARDDYSERFRKAFGIKDRKLINSDLIAKALAQYERIIVSGNSRYDRFLREEIALTDEEDLGRHMFFDFDDGLKDAECSHCHSYPLFTANTYHNNGLDSVGSNYALFKDIGLGINGMVGDTGKFRATTLRNIAITAPYMHDGRFNSLADVMNHYDHGIQHAVNLDPQVANLFITEEQKESIIAFMEALTDTSYLQNELVVSPFE